MTPTSWSRSPKAQTISVALGKREMIRIAVPLDSCNEIEIVTDH
ncbi:hypothetical protein RMSM_06756 [Rhodopirellula maiorica SM1]|uniref:Uncharacterized protein n=1 Tax=Rhodopirellula maiorica SM1 TaxID=1265738 RepID=M5RLU7_9BACT|nr:hypothetical protein RMSM_06756 [Rhodopirellula maiorica SM1]